VWDQFTGREAEAVARALERCLPAPWVFDGVEHHACGDQRRQVAFFRGNGQTRFALIPGGAVTLGHDPARPLGPQLVERKVWLDECPDLPEEPETSEEEDQVFEYNSWADFFGFLDNLPRPRTVEMQPFLIEVEPRAFGDFAKGLTFRAM